MHDLSPLPPYPFQDEVERLLRGERSTAAATRDLYLDLVGAIIDQAAAWVDGKGVVIDPVEGHDNRWQGGTAARFACPAAILIRERGRQDLLPIATRAIKGSLSLPRLVMTPTTSCSHLQPTMVLSQSVRPISAVVLPAIPTLAPPSMLPHLVVTPGI